MYGYSVTSAPLLYLLQTDGMGENEAIITVINRRDGAETCKVSQSMGSESQNYFNRTW